MAQPPNFWTITLVAFPFFHHLTYSTIVEYVGRLKLCKEVVE